MPTPIHQLTDSWPNDGQPYDGIRLDVTDSQSPSASNRLFRLRRNGADLLEVRSDGALRNSGTLPPSYPIVQWSADGNLNLTESVSCVVLQTGTLTATRTLTLPAASSMKAGSEVIVSAGASVSGSTSISIQRTGGDTISGGTSATISTPWEILRLVTDGASSWRVNAGALRASNNLSDVPDPAAARANLGIVAGSSEAERAALRSSSYIPGIEMPLATSRVTSRLVVGSAIDDDPGAGPLTIWCRFRVPASLATNAGICGLGPNETHLLGGSGSNAIALGVHGGDVQLFMGNSTTYTRYPLGLSGLAGQFVDVVVTRSGATLAIYANGNSVALSPVNENGSVAADATIAATWAHAAAALSATLTSSNNVITGPVQRFTCFNRALTQAEASALIRDGIDPADQWGSKTAIISPTVLNGGFETAGAGGTDVFTNWTESAGTGVLVRDTSLSDSGSASARFEVAAGNGFMSLSQSVLIPGKRYRIQLAYRHARNGFTFSPQAAIKAAANISSWVGSSVAANTWGTFTAEDIADTAAFSVARNGSVGGSINQWYDSITVTRIGAFLDLDFGGNSGTQASDRANQRDANSYNGAGFTLPQARHGFASWVAVTPGGERMGGSSGLVIPLDAAITRILVENISVGSGQTVNIGPTSGTITEIVNAAPIGGNGSVTVIDPATSTSSTGQLWVGFTGSGAIQVTVFFERA